MTIDNSGIGAIAEKLQRQWPINDALKWLMENYKMPNGKMAIDSDALEIVAEFRGTMNAAELTELRAAMVRWQADNKELVQ
jgi:hypothetical protein